MYVRIMLFSCNNNFIFFVIGAECKKIEKISTKDKNKRKKCFTSSQKLCLKSQRIGLSQSYSQKQNPNNESKTLPLSQPLKVLENNLQSSEVLCVDSLNFLPSDLSVPSKVYHWLSDLPDSQQNESNHETNGVETNGLNGDCSTNASRRISVYPQKELSDRNSFKIEYDINNCIERLSNENKISTYNQEFRLNNNKDMRRISVHPAPSLKSENYIDIYCGVGSSFSDLSSLENEDPNNMSAMISQKSIVQDQHVFTTPLQTWLKQELLLSTNNNVAKSQDTAKSIIVCAAKTRDIIISVGCSHITCETCYPESTTLLLGYC